MIRIGRPRIWPPGFEFAHDSFRGPRSATQRIVMSPDTPTSSETILIVEDEVLIRMELADYLRGCGYRVLEAANAAEALTVMQTDHRVDLVFSDVQMPGPTDGFGLARWVRANRPGVTVILTSGVARSAARAGELCEDGPLEAKPYEHARLLERIKRTLAQVRRPDASCSRRAAA
jgi:CheY-like chemotaxis protein